MSANKSWYLMLAGFLPGGRADETSGFSLPVEDLAPLLETALTQKMLPALGQERVITQLSLPDELAGELRTILAMNTRRNAGLKAQALAAIRALNREGISPLLLKGGAAMQEDLYAIPGALLTVDTDLAVRKEDWKRSLRVLLGAGFEQTAPIRWDRHHLPPLLHTATSTTLELHRWFSKRGTEGLLPAHECWSRTQERTAAGGESFHLLEPTDALVHNIIHAQLHHVGYLCCAIRLKNLYDFALIARKNHDVIDWTRVQRATRAPLYARAARWHVGLSRILFPWAGIPEVSTSDPFARVKWSMSPEAHASFSRQMKLLSNLIYEPGDTLRHYSGRLFSRASLQRNWSDAVTLFRHARAVSAQRS